MTWADAKQYVARANGGQGNPDNLVLAGDAISTILARLNTYHEWSWLVLEESISVTSGAADYATTSDIKAPYTVRLLTSQMTLPQWTQREIDRLAPDQTTTAGPVCYALYRAATFDPQYGHTTRIRLFPTPTVSETMLVKYARVITQTGSDTAFVDVRDDILYDALNGARGEYLLVKDAENKRSMALLSRFEARLKQLRSWDLMGSTDRDKRLVAMDEWGGVEGMGSDSSSTSSSTTSTGDTAVIQGESLVPDSGA